jgi:hypothetical protein
MYSIQHLFREIIKHRVTKVSMVVLVPGTCTCKVPGTVWLIYVLCTYRRKLEITVFATNNKLRSFHCVPEGFDSLDSRSTENRE